MSVAFTASDSGKKCSWNAQNELSPRPAGRFGIGNTGGETGVGGSGDRVLDVREAKADIVALGLAGEAFRRFGQVAIGVENDVNEVVSPGIRCRLVEQDPDSLLRRWSDLAEPAWRHTETRGTIM